MDPRRVAKRLIADTHEEANTDEAENLGIEYGITLTDVRTAVDAEGQLPAEVMPSMILKHFWGDDQVLLSLAITLPDGTAAYATRHLDAGIMLTFLTEASRNLKERDLGVHLADA